LSVNSAAEINVTTVIDRSRYGGFQWLLLSLCLVVAMFDGYDSQGIAYVAPLIAKDLGVGPAQLGPIFASGLIGLMVGAIIWGMAADKVGRKAAVIWSVVIFGIFSIATPWAHTLTSMLTLRFLAGIGMGGALPNVIALISEYTPARTRGLVVNSPNSFFALGSVVGGLLAAKLIPIFGWQSTFYVGGAVPLVFAIVLALWLPESARFLLVARESQARVAALIRRIDKHGSYPDTTRFTLETAVKGITVKHLFTEGRTPATLLIWLAVFMNLFVLLYLINWLPTLLRTVGQPIETAIMTTVWYSIGGFFGGLCMGRLADHFGGYRVLAITYLGAGVFIAAAAYTIGNNALFIPAMFMTGVAIQGGQASLNTLTAAYYPTAIRATGLGWALGVGRIGSFIGPILGGMFLAAGWSVNAVILVNVVPAVICALAILALRYCRSEAQTVQPRVEVAAAS
jgi:AAHS family 4-hydroxybenzoate transporter-like MFS transporter